MEGGTGPLQADRGEAVSLRWVARPAPLPLRSADRVRSPVEAGRDGALAGPSPSLGVAPLGPGVSRPMAGAEDSGAALLPARLRRPLPSASGAGGREGAGSAVAMATGTPVPAAAPARGTQPSGGVPGPPP